MSLQILGVKLDGLGLVEVKSRIIGFLEEDRVHQITPVNPEFIMAARRDRELRDISNESDLTVADGVGLKIAGKFLRHDVGQRITGVDLTWEIVKIATEKDLSVYLLGAADGVAAKAAERLSASYPALRIAGTYAGSPAEKGIVERVNDSGADILLVAFGVPKQEKFIHGNKDKLQVRVAMCVGGTFDFIAGIIPRAPKWMRAAGLEWLFRLIKQPQRIKRIITATIRFPLAVAVKRLGEGRRQRSIV